MLLADETITSRPKSFHSFASGWKSIASRNYSWTLANFPALWLSLVDLAASLLLFFFFFFLFADVMHDESSVASPTGFVPTCWGHAQTPHTSPGYHPTTLLTVSLLEVSGVLSMLSNTTVFISLSSNIRQIWLKRLSFLYNYLSLLLRPLKTFLGIL